MRMNGLFLSYLGSKAHGAFVAAVKFDIVTPGNTHVDSGSSLLAQLVRMSTFPFHP